MTAASSPLISIGLPVYNGGAFLEQAVDAILAQTWEDFELIISDNASTDATEEIAQMYTKRDRRVRYVRNPENRGAAFNYNQTVALARGKFFKWAAADDWIAPTFLETCLSPLQADETVILVYPHTVMVDASGQTIEIYQDELHLTEEDPGRRFAHFLARFRRKDKCNAVFGLIRMVGLRQTRLIDRFTSSDITLLGELALLGKMVEIPQGLFYRRDHPGSSVRALKPAERTAWFDPSLKGARSYVQWRLGWEFMRSLVHLPLSLRTRLIGMLEVVRWGLWRRTLLGAEAQIWMWYQAQRLPSPVYAGLRSLWHWARNSAHKSLEL